VTLVDDHCKELSSDSFCGAVFVGAVSVGAVSVVQFLLVQFLLVVLFVSSLCAVSFVAGGDCRCCVVVWVSSDAKVDFSVFFVLPLSCR